MDKPKQQTTEGRSKLILTRVTTAALLLGMILIPLEYLERQDNSRKTTTLEYIEKYFSGESPISQYQWEIEKTWNAHAEEVTKCKEAETDEACRNRIRQYVLAIIEDHDMGHKIDKIVDFYGLLEKCISGRICDEDIAVSFFGREAYLLQKLLIAYFDDRREKLNNPLYDEDVKSLVQRYQLSLGIQQ